MAAELNGSTLNIAVGGAARVNFKPSRGVTAQWESSAPDVVEVFQNGFVAGLKPGHAKVTAVANGESSECLVIVDEPNHALVDPATLKQFPDNRKFAVNGRTCFGSELNGQRAFDPVEKRVTRSNRIINPKPLRRKKPLDWELKAGTEVYDGAGVLMGTVPATAKVGDRLVPVSMFNFGASKIVNGRICLYAFAVSINPTPEVEKLIGPGELKEGKVDTSAWLPLDDVVDKETLLERIGLGNARLPALPLETTGYRVTGGNPKMYESPFGELRIIRPKKIAAVPSHYLRRPSGTVNLIYSVPGYGLGGEGTDSFLVSDGVMFHPAKGAKVFKQPTYFPPKHPSAGKTSSMTMTFLYGAIIGKGSEPIYGWIAEEALDGITPRLVPL